ncbi:MAG: hypothetical protein LBJ67_05755 [Planctomycetaceae bacterium]|jgi:hypothetical protein|nr:hypothetical protein [Planctomycetaceae bacterium]
MMNKHLLLLFWVVLVLFAGCSRKVQLGGKITFADNGEPLTVGTVGFTDGQFMARSQINQEGLFQLSWLGEKDGIPKGEYKIFITGANRYEEGTVDEDKDGKFDLVAFRIIHSKYENWQTSGLSIKVDGSTKSFDIQVERPVGGKPPTKK